MRIARRERARADQLQADAEAYVWLRDEICQLLDPEGDVDGDEAEESLVFGMVERAWKDGADRLAELVVLREQVAALTTALGFYAERRNYNTDCPNCTEYYAVPVDEGDRARAALCRPGCPYPHRSRHP
jgi:hypothetical protein